MSSADIERMIAWMIEQGIVWDDAGILGIAERGEREYGWREYGWRTTCR